MYMERFLNTLEIGNAQLLILLEVVVAMLLGGVIGYEREESDKPAGLRTQMLVAGAAALFVGLGNLIIQRFGGSFGSDTIRSDPIRIFEAIITGVSFLGAGTIIRRAGDDHVEGITTAASLLMTAAIGATIGLKQWFLGIVMTLLVFAVLHLMRRFKPHKSQEKPAKSANEMK